MFLLTGNKCKTTEKINKRQWNKLGFTSKKEFTFAACHIFRPYMILDRSNWIPQWAIQQAISVLQFALINQCKLWVSNVKCDISAGCTCIGKQLRTDSKSAEDQGIFFSKIPYKYAG